MRWLAGVRPELQFTSEKARRPEGSFSTRHPVFAMAHRSRPGTPHTGLGNAVLDRGVIAGNYENKYASSNPIARRLMQGFLGAVTGLARQSGCVDALEVGCGEGLLAIHLAERAGLKIRGTDFSEAIIERARANAVDAGVNIEFGTLDLNALDATGDGADLLVCCEVLEHLEDPDSVLERLCRLRCKRLLLSVPREPLWRALNMARGKYLSRFGNTPGHINHWSAHRFVKFVGRHADVLEVKRPVPWTVVLAQPRHALGAQRMTRAQR
jgi:2-polyprenyl-3-methyl-5-hydroxy-6-metoxy-1,4-benzoquinol methylase